MKIVASIVQDRPETWFQGTKDERAVRIFTCLDQDTEAPMPNTFDYRPTTDEMSVIPAGSANGKTVTLAIREMKAAKAGRFVMAGRIATLDGKPVPAKPSTASAPGR